MKKILYATVDSWSPTLLRILAGLILFPHGAQKLLGWFGGFGFTGTIAFFTQTMGFPWWLGCLIILIEFFGSIALVIGLGTRIIAATMLVLMTGIILTSHLQYGFFMNWFGNQKGEGYEYFLLYIAISFSLLMTGGGKYAVDRQLAPAKPTPRS